MDCRIRFPPDIEAALFRVIQGAIGNVAQHSKAKHANILLDFHPDIVCNIKDPWMLIEHESAFRDFFHLAWMPTCDSAPQQPAWIDMFSRADAIFTYSDWGLEVLREQSNNQIKLQCSTYPGTNLNIFKPDKRTMTLKTGWLAYYFPIYKKLVEFSRKIKVFKSYKARRFGSYNKTRDEVFPVFNTEELATIYHFPAIMVEAPRLKRLETKKGGPPAGLPIE